MHLPTDPNNGQQNEFKLSDRRLKKGDRQLSYNKKSKIDLTIEYCTLGGAIKESINHFLDT